MTSQNTADLETIRKRLRYRAWHRGMLEMDLVLGHFADVHLAGFGEDELARFELVLEELDGDLMSWITGQYAIRDDADHEMITRIMAFQAERTSV